MQQQKWTPWILPIVVALVLVSLPLRVMQPAEAQSPRTEMLAYGNGNGGGTIRPFWDCGKAEDAAHTSGDCGEHILGVRKDTSAQSTNADGDYSSPSLDAYGTLFFRQDHPNRFHCTVAVSVATILTAVGAPCAAPGAGLSLYVTDVFFSASAAGIAADAFPTLKYGTTGSCGTGTTIFWQALSAAAVIAVDNRSVPIKIPANNEICWIDSTAGSKTLQVSGFIAP